MLSTEVVVLGGGIMAQEEYLAKKIRGAVDKYLVASIASRTRIAFAQHRNDAGMLGAFYHFRSFMPGKGRTNGILCKIRSTDYRI